MRQPQKRMDTRNYSKIETPEPKRAYITSCEQSSEPCLDMDKKDQFVIELRFEHQ